MKAVFFYHSLVSDWNHGNAHFLRGIVAELQDRGVEVVVYEPQGGWSRANLMRDHGSAPLRRFRKRFPGLRSALYDPARFDPAESLADADLVVVHEWTEPDVARRIARHRAAGGRYRLLFHDTHHRMVSDPGAFDAVGLERFDGILAYGQSLSRLYGKAGWGRSVWTWHEAADTRVFRPLPKPEKPEGDLVWIGNWGDGERSRALHDAVLRPTRELGLRTRIHGVRYPAEALQAVAECGASFGGWLANFEVPDVFARYLATIHVPRRPYLDTLPGIPTIRPFEALACGIPLVSVGWEDREGLFRADDYLFAANPADVRRHLRALRADPALRAALAANGLATIRARHTCAHRVDELFDVCRELGMAVPAAISAAPYEKPLEAAQ